MSGQSWRKSSLSTNANNCVEVASWRKSSRSNNANNCVELASWRKSSRSENGTNCVEVSDVSTVGILVRDSKLGDESPILAVGADQWRVFLRYATAATAG
jgi:hypothetical protein